MGKNISIPLYNKWNFFLTEKMQIWLGKLISSCPLFSQKEIRKEETEKHASWRWILVMNTITTHGRHTTLSKVTDKKYFNMIMWVKLCSEMHLMFNCFHALQGGVSLVTHGWNLISFRSSLPTVLKMILLCHNSTSRRLVGNTGQF